MSTRAKIGKLAFDRERRLRKLLAKVMLSPVKPDEDALIVPGVVVAQIRKALSR